MKKLLKFIGRLIRRIGMFFDKWLITPITKMILIITDFFKNNSKSFDRFLGKKSTLLVLLLLFEDS